VDGTASIPDEFLQAIKDVVDAGPMPGPKIVDRGGFSTVQCQKIGFCTIMHVNKIAFLLAIPEDGHRLIANHLPGKDGNDAACTIGILPGTIHIGIPQDNIFQSIIRME